MPATAFQRVPDAPGGPAERPPPGPTCRTAGHPHEGLPYGGRTCRTAGAAVRRPRSPAPRTTGLELVTRQRAVKAPQATYITTYEAVP
ncbi:hypothetical protein ACWDR9_36880, partial [Streptosporangium sandarakinum]